MEVNALRYHVPGRTASHLLHYARARLNPRRSVDLQRLHCSWRTNFFISRQLWRTRPTRREFSWLSCVYGGSVCESHSTIKPIVSSYPRLYVLVLREGLSLAATPG